MTKTYSTIFSMIKKCWWKNINKKTKKIKKISKSLSLLISRNHDFYNKTKANQQNHLSNQWPLWIKSSLSKSQNKWKRYRWKAQGPKQTLLKNPNKQKNAKRRINLKMKKNHRIKSMWSRGLFSCTKTKTAHWK